MNIYRGVIRTKVGLKGRLMRSIPSVIVTSHSVYIKRGNVKLCSISKHAILANNSDPILTRERSESSWHPS